MCYYDLTRYVCGCQVWSELQWPCYEACQQPEQDSPRKHVGKHLHDRAGRRCPRKGVGCPAFFEGSIPDNSPGSNPWTWNTIGLRPAREKYCSIPDCVLLRVHPSPCEIRTRCETAGCILGLLHAGNHIVG